jgi:HCOMODA/2-hydroxy-3-carboxy-muconic semialdehyde decarboxylase
MSFEQKQLLLQGCRVLTEYGIFDEHGHLSARTRDDDETAVVNGHCSPLTANLSDFVTFDFEDGGYPEHAPGETTLHAQIYRARDDVEAVCHNHAPYATAVASMGVEMRPVHPNGAIQVDPIRVYDDIHEAGGVLVTEDPEGKDVAALLGDDAAVMLRGHGAVVTGTSIADAVVSSIKLEFNARMLYYQSQFGEPWYLPEDLVEREVERVHSDSGIEKSLDFYLATSG